MRESVYKTLAKVIKTECITMMKFLLLACGERTGEVFCNGAVEVPLDVVDFVFAQDLGNSFYDIIAYVFACDIQHELTAGNTRLRSGNGDRPIGMCAVKIAVGVDHFGFKPDTEFHTGIVNVIDNGGKTVREDLGAYRPISKTRFVVSASAEPAVVKHEGINARTADGVDDGEQTLGRATEVYCLPAIDDERMGNVGEAFVDEIFSVSIVIFTRHTSDAFIRVCKYDLGCCKRFTCGKLPSEIKIVDTACQTCVALRTDLSLERIRCGVNEVHAKRTACIFCCVFADQRHCGAVATRGGCGFFIYANDAVRKRCAFGLALTRPCVFDGEQVVIGADNVERKAVCAENFYVLIRAVFNFHMAGNNGCIIVYRIEKMNAHFRKLILECKLQRFTAAHGGHTGKSGLFCEDLVCFIEKFVQSAAVLLQKLE